MEYNMRLISLVLLSFFLCSPVLSSEWTSPIEEKYSANSPRLYKKLNEARNILNSWGGQTNKLRKADLLLKEILEADKEYAPAYREYARLLIMEGYLNYDNFVENNLNIAEEYILESIRIETSYADSYVLLGHLYTIMNRYKDAEEALIVAGNMGTKNPWLELNWASFFKKQGNYEEAIKRYEAVIKTSPTDKNAFVSALEQASTIYENTGKLDKANEAYKKLIAIDPETAWHWGNYSSFLLFNYHDVDDAIEHGRKAINIMDYGYGRLILACALYTKWALLIQNPRTEGGAQQYFDEAYAIYPNIEYVIEKTKEYIFTKITSVELSKLQESKPE